MRSWMLAVLIAVPFLSYAQSGQTPYAGQEKREIKALSADEVQAYLSGQGMGFAKAAELNHYPGPRHVLDMASQLQLSKAQIAETQKVYNKMHEEATRLGKLIVDKERDLDNLFARSDADSYKLQAAIKEIAGLQGELRIAHLQAHLEMKRILYPEQIKKYDKLRGYGASEGTGSHTDQ